MPRAPSIPKAMSNARSRVEFKLEIVQMLHDRIEHLTNRRGMYQVGSGAYNNVDETISEFRTFRLEVEALEFKIDTRKNST